MRGAPASSRRAAGVQLPVIPTVGGWIAETPGTISLGQGVVHYGPPPEATAAIAAFLGEGANHKYVNDPGLPSLRRAFEKKLREENGIHAPFARRIVVTAGANQGFVNAILAICDPGDEVILLSPYYFNHEMAIALADCVPVVVPTDDAYQPRLDAIEAAVTERTRAVVTVSPNNPTGAVYPRQTLAAVNALCAARGLFHISDEAYEYFTYDGAEHFSPGSLPGAGGHTISLFSLSKSYGMASWRVGFLVAPERLYDDIIKIQDTVVVCAPAISQHVGLKALEKGRAWCRPRVEALARVRADVYARLSSVPDLLHVPATRGALYFLVKVNTAMDPLRLSERLIRVHRVAAIPGGTFGVRGSCSLRVSYGSLAGADALEGVERLVRGVKAIVTDRRKTPFRGRGRAG